MKNKKINPEISKTQSNKRLIGILIAGAVVLLIPVVAMQFTNDVNWNLTDFIMMGILLLAMGLLCEFVLRKVKKTKYRILACGAISFVFLLIWVDLAVGVFNISGFSGS